MPDTLIIAGLTAQCRIGVADEERAQPQTIVVDLELAIDAHQAARRDDVHDAVDYAALVHAVRGAAEQKPWHLLETLADDLAILILKDFHVPEVRVRVSKRALPGIDHAAVRVVRSGS